MQIDLIGRKITKIRPMTKKEMDAECWDEGFHGRPIAIVLDDGTRLYPSRDDEGNGGGALFGMKKGGGQFRLA